jgi:hypothetical protein
VFEELGDVSLLQCDGNDYHGRDVGLRFRGLSRAENIHQKVSVTFSPRGLGRC